MTPKIEDHLLAMDQKLRKIHKHKVSADAKTKNNDGRIEISSANSNVKNHVVNLESRTSKATFLQQNRLVVL